MKNIIYTLLILSVLSFFVSCTSNNDGQLSPDLIANPNSANGEEPGVKLPVMTFKESEHDFGKIVDGIKVSYSFKFTNTGGSDLIVSHVKTSCGCTVSKFDKEPIPPGGKGKIQLTFDATHRRGFNSKTATVIANTQPNTQVIKITAMVVGPDEL